MPIAGPFLLGGHRYSKRLPWFRGQHKRTMEAENLALCQGCATMNY